MLKNKWNYQSAVDSSEKLMNKDWNEVMLWN